MICAHLRMFQFYSFGIESNSATGFECRIFFFYWFFFLFAIHKVTQSILPPFSEAFKNPLLYSFYCYCCYCWSLRFFQTRYRVNTPPRMLGCLLFSFPFNGNATTRIPQSSMKHNKTIAHRINLRKVFFFFLSFFFVVVVAVVLTLILSIIGCCVLCTIFNEMNWIELKKWSTESEMNAEGILRCKHCKHFLFQFSMYEYVYCGCVCVFVFALMSVSATRWRYTNTHQSSCGALLPLLLDLLYFSFSFSDGPVCVCVGEKL